MQFSEFCKRNNTKQVPLSPQLKKKTVAYTPTIYTDHMRSMNQEHGHMQHSCVGLQGHLMCSSKALAHAQHNQGLHGLSAEPP